MCGGVSFRKDPPTSAGLTDSFPISTGQAEEAAAALCAGQVNLHL